MAAGFQPPVNRIGSTAPAVYRTGNQRSSENRIAGGKNGRLAGLEIIYHNITLSVELKMQIFYKAGMLDVLEPESKYYQICRNGKIRAGKLFYLPALILFNPFHFAAV